jgi:hypothetical protein
MTAMSHPFQCRCGQVRGEVEHPEGGMRATCYCLDCQTYAHLLGEPDRVLDAQGGTDVVATQARYVRFTSGTDALACLSLSPRGLMRWYARCCNTPIANTPRHWKLPYVGLVHTCLRQPLPLEQSFPHVQLRANTKSAHGEAPKGGNVGGMVRLAGLMAKLAGQRLTGGYRTSPFFGADGTPTRPVEVAPRDAVEQARRAVAAG